MIIGLFHLTTPRDGQKNEGHAFSSVSEALMAMDRHEIELYTKVKIRLDGDQFVAPEGWKLLRVTGLATPCCWTAPLVRFCSTRLCRRITLVPRRGR